MNRIPLRLDPQRRTPAPDIFLTIKLLTSTLEFSIIRG